MIGVEPRRRGSWGEHSTTPRGNARIAECKSHDWDKADRVGAQQGDASMEFIHQPSDSSRLGDYLSEGFAGPWTHFRAAIAFVKRSGIRNIEGSLASFARNHDVEIIVGIDHRGTSYEGLQSLLKAVSSAGPAGKVVVFHNPTFRTFHPKVYLFKSAVAADVVVGSGNLTEGGLFANYEAGIRLRLDLSDPNEAAVLKCVEQVLDRWSDQSRGTARLLDEQLLTKLAAWGLTPSETLIASSHRGEQEDVSGLILDLADFPFAASAESEARRVPFRQRHPSEGVLSEQPLTVPGPHIGFVMTLHQTDVGVGQMTSGSPRRSPEIFVPLAARNADARFWDWPGGFVEDPRTGGKFDRRGVRMRLANEIINVNMMTWPARHDFRLRSESLRSAGNIGDILRMERALDPNADYEYYVEVIPHGTTQHPVYLALCSNPVRNSQKRYGYY